MRAALVIAAIVSVAACSNPRRVKCDKPIAGLEIPPGGVLWFGEMHGTEESPRFIGDVVCQAARVNNVQLGLEIWQSEQLRINTYLLDGNRETLLAGPFWAQHDGRSSNAMLALLDRVRDLRKNGGRLDVVAYDTNFAKDRDGDMAKAVIAARNKTATFIGLSGNIHSRKTKWNDITPLVAHLLAADVPVRTHDVSSSGGTFWACIGELDKPVCGEHPNSNDGGKQKPWSVGPPRDASHDAAYFVGPTKASYPAKP